jgi:hypothetical protein
MANITQRFSRSRQRRENASGQIAVGHASPTIDAESVHGKPAFVVILDPNNTR